MIIRWRHGGSDQDLRVTVSDPDATVADLVAALGVPGGTLAVDGITSAGATPLCTSAIPDGALLEVGLGAPRRPEPPALNGVDKPLEVVIIAGFDAGGAVAVNSSPVTVGRSQRCDVVLHDLAASREHCVIERRGGDVFLQDLASGNGTVVGGRPVVPNTETPVSIGELVACGDSLLTIRERVFDRPTALERGRRPNGSIEFYRPPPAEPGRKPLVLALPRPPTEATKPVFQVTALLAPIGMAVVMVVVTRRPQYALFALLSPIMLLANRWEARHRRLRNRSTESRRYQEELRDFGGELRNEVDAETKFRRESHPDAAAVVRWAHDPSARLWERRPDHTQFGQVVVGIGDVPWRPALDGGEISDEVDDLLSATALLTDVPITVKLSAGTSIGIAGDRPSALAVARHIVIQEAALSGPADLALAALTDAEAAHDWDWLKWLPHTASRADARLLAVGAANGQGLAEELDAMPNTRSVLVVVDAERLADAGNGFVRSTFRGRRVSGVIIASSPDVLPDLCDPVIRITDESKLEVRSRRDAPTKARAVGISLPTAEAYALNLAPLRDPEHQGHAAELPRVTRLVEMMGLNGSGAEAVVERWTTLRAVHEPLPLAIGTKSSARFDLDDDGHLLVAGAVAAGKSELLRTTLAGLAVTRHPDDLHMVLVGRDLAACGSFPHVVAVIAEPDDVNITDLATALRQRAKRMPANSGPDVVVAVDDVDQLASRAPKGLPLLIDVLRRPAAGTHILASASRPAGVLEMLGEMPGIRIGLRPPSGITFGDWLGDPTVSPEGPRRAGSAIWSSVLGRQSVQLACTFDATPPPTKGVVVEPFTIAQVGQIDKEAPGTALPDIAQIARWITEAQAATGVSAAPRLRPELAQTTGPGPRLVELLGIADPGAFDPDLGWTKRTEREMLRVPIGLAADGGVVELDIKESAFGGMGPHGLCVGATGSGKSELLRTLVAALAVTHSPDDVNFVLIDFKGGAAFAELNDLPHVAGSVNDLETDLSLVDRVADALRAEMRRRLQVLSDAGNLPNVTEYNRLREGGRPLEALPHLLVIIDEFVELLTNAPEFVDVLVAIGRLGRAPGVHLLLSSQQMEEGKLKGLDRNIRYRIALRTETATESRAILGVADASTLPSEPGHALMKVDDIRRFRAAFVSDHYKPPGADRPEETTVLEVLVDRLRGRGAAHQVWLPPLPAVITLDALLPPFIEDATRGLIATGWPGVGRLMVPLGLVDKPLEQAQEPLTFDFTGSDGHLMVIGAPQSGKSTFLRTAIMALALTHAPTEVAFYGVDAGGGSLTSLNDLPHVGSIASRQERELTRRIVGHMETLLGQREALFQKHHIDAPATFRAMRSRGDLPEESLGDVFFVVDGWGAFRTEYESAEPVIADLAARGLGFGLHVLLSAARWGDVRASLQDSIGGRIELRLNNPADSLIDRRTASRIPSNRPGRAINQSKLASQVAVPRADGAARLSDLPAATAALVTRSAAVWGPDGVPPVRLLPPRVSLDSVRPGDGAVFSVPFGIRESDMGAACLDLVAGDPHFVVFGDGESGKTTFIRTWATELILRSHGPKTVQIVLIDYRRTLLESLDEAFLTAYGGAAPAAQDAISTLRQTLMGRLPGADVTPAQLRDRSWWEGPDFYVVVDDYDLVASPTANPLTPLLDLLQQARDVGLHVVVARRVSGAAKALYEPVLSRIREVSASGLILSGDRAEGPLISGIRASEQPRGRGIFVLRRRAPELIQVATLD